MAKKSARSITENPGMVMVITYAVLLLVNAAVIVLANNFFPAQVVLGAAHIPFWHAVVMSSGKLALLGTFAIPFVREMEARRGEMLNTQEWMLAYFFINAIGLWLVARFAQQLGLGIASWRVVVVLAVVLDLVQGAAMMQVEKWRTGSN